MCPSSELHPAKGPQLTCANSVHFVKCDVTSWNDQARLFKEASSLTGKVDHVVANAGVSTNDEVFEYAGKLDDRSHLRKH